MRIRLMDWHAARALIFLCTLVGPAAAEQLTVIGFNVESGGADPRVIGRQIEGIHGCDVWGLSEVQDGSWATQFEAAAGRGEHADFRGILGTTGGNDRLLILYNSTRLDATRHFELADLNLGGHVRAPLVAEFQIKPAGLKFLFMVNHLYRTKADGREQQSRLLNQWAAAQTLPVIAVGDYNFDWNLRAGDKDHDAGYDLLTAGDVFSWIPPLKMLRTKCAVPKVLDFTFVAGPARNWSATSDILFVEESYCPDDRTTSDHRPVRTTFSLDGATAAVPKPELSPEMMLHRIERLEHEIGLPPE